MEAAIDNVSSLNKPDPLAIEATDIEQEAARAAAEDGPDKVARQWLLSSSVATLCTLAAKPEIEGFPFGSVVPYALDEEGAPLIYLADIAAHAGNLRRDARATLFVREAGLEGDPQKGWRLGVIGRFAKVRKRSDATVGANSKGEILEVDDEQHEAWMARYIETVPFAKDYGATHPFHLWRMQQVERVRYIAGFGKISWLGGEAVARPSLDDAFVSAAKGAVEHMNADHRDALREMVKAQTGADDDAKMVSLDRTGFFVRTAATNTLVHFSFGDEIDASGIKAAVIQTLRRVRQAGGTA